MKTHWLQLSCGVCRGTSVVGISLLLWLGLSAPSQGDELKSTDLSDMPAGLVYRDSSGQQQRSLPLHTKVDMRVSGLTNRVTVTQEFVNQTEQWLNAKYLFPLPNDSAVDAMRLVMGERIIEGQIQEKQQAKQRFRQAKREGKKASLVEQLKANIFSTEVANLAPGEHAIVTLSYQQQLAYQDGRFSLRFPMAITPRYAPSLMPAVYQQVGVAKQEQANHSWSDLAALTPPTWSVGEPLLAHAQQQYTGALLGRSALAADLTIHLDSGFEVDGLRSLYHPVAKTMRSDGSIDVVLQAIPANRDFVLEWQPQVGQRPEAALYVQQGRSHEPSTVQASLGDDYALLMLLPPQDELQPSASIPRELILVIDTSGSMAGESIIQARQALLQALDGLQPHDRFNIIEFNSYHRLFSPQPVAASADSLQRARRFVTHLQADGGTEMLPAMAAALAHQPVDSTVHLRQVIFITDGAVSNEPQLFELIKHQLAASRLFTIGIGSAPNSHFMQRAAELGKGTFTYIGDQRELAEKMSRLLDKISRPVVSDIQLRYRDGSVPDYWPAIIPDLYAGQPLALSIKLPHASQPQLLISGRIGGQAWQRHVNLTANKQAAGLDLLWARQQIAALELSKNGANDQRVKQQVLALAMQYHLVSSQTSLVAVDLHPNKPQGVQAFDEFVAPSMPAGWQAPPGQLPQTASGSRLTLSLGLLLLLLSWVLWQAPWPIRRARL